MASEEMNRARNILVADDDENDVLLLRLAFQKAGLPHNLIHVRDGQEAIDYLSGKSSKRDRPNLLLLDLKMPLVNGFDVLGWLQSQSPTMLFPVVVLSSSPLAADRTRAKDLGAEDYLAKPTHMEEMTQLAHSVHERWLKA